MILLELSMMILDDVHALIDRVSLRPVVMPHRDRMKDRHDLPLVCVIDREWFTRIHLLALSPVARDDFRRRIAVDDERTIAEQDRLDHEVLACCHPTALSKERTVDALTRQESIS